MELYELQARLAELEDEFLNDAIQVSAEQLGLDARACYKLYVTPDAVIANGSDVTLLNYYGGFEYIDEESITRVGSLVIYSGEHNRVRECLEYFFVDTE